MCIFDKEVVLHICVQIEKNVTWKFSHIHLFTCFILWQSESKWPQLFDVIGK